MIRSAVPLWLTLLLLGACLETHDAANQQIGREDCYTCHTKQYQDTGTIAYPLSPQHDSSGCSTQCAQCHTTTAWPTGLGGCAHPEANFPLASASKSPHAGIKCIDCHSSAIAAATGATSQQGLDTDCIGCHPNTSTQKSEHVGVVYDAGALIGQPYAYSTADHRFCLDCHPKGLAIGHKPTNPFALPHHGAHCNECHDTASGLGHQNGADTLCVTSGCHRESHHQSTAHHPSCLDAGCHPDGRKHDNLTFR